jgi:hypothetical protein
MPFPAPYSTVIYLIKNNVMKACTVTEMGIHAVLTSELNRREWSASRPGPFTPRKYPVPIGIYTNVLQRFKI